MIKLVKEDYCEDCNYFSPTADYFIGDNGKRDCFVYCERYNICNHICGCIYKFMENRDNVEKGEMKNV